MHPHLQLEHGGLRRGLRFSYSPFATTHLPEPFQEQPPQKFPGNVKFQGRRAD
jgi:hypothetical protein